MSTLHRYLPDSTAKTGAATFDLRPVVARKEWTNHTKLDNGSNLWPGFSFDNTCFFLGTTAQPKPCQDDWVEMSSPGNTSSDAPTLSLSHQATLSLSHQATLSLSHQATLIMQHPHFHFLIRKTNMRKRSVWWKRGGGGRKSCLASPRSQETSEV